MKFYSLTHARTVRDREAETLIEELKRAGHLNPEQRIERICRAEGDWSDELLHVIPAELWAAWDGTGGPPVFGLPTLHAAIAEIAAREAAALGGGVVSAWLKQPTHAGFWAWRMDGDSEAHMDQLAHAVQVYPDSIDGRLRSLCCGANRLVESVGGEWLPLAPATPPCVWREDWEGNWDTECATKFYLPSELDTTQFPFCAKCGGKIEAVNYVEQKEEA